MRSTIRLHLVLLRFLICFGCVMENSEAPNQVYDVAIKDVKVSSICPQGENLPITINVANRGNQRETFQVILSEGTSGKEIASKEVTFAKGWKGGSEGIADVIFNGETEGVQEFGSGIWSGSDINGDGHDDVLISAPRWNENRGRVYLYYGGANIDPSHPDITFSGQDPNTHLGDYFGIYSCDVNLDGYDDVLLGAWGYNRYSGRVYIHFGGPKINTEADMVLDGEAEQEGWFGAAITSSDIDQDGYKDILVSAQNYNNGVGRVYIFWGGNHMDTSPDVLLEGEGFPGGKTEPAPGLEGIETQGWFGRKISASGDVNGDGYNDILIGARYAGGKESNGAAYLFLGNTKDKMDSRCDYIFRGENYNAQMGSSVVLFDINKDEFAEVIIGARYAADYRGRVYLYWGKYDFDANSPDLILEGEPRSHIGGDEIVCGYFNSDEYDDILIGGAGYPDPTNPENRMGRAYVFNGNKKELMDRQADHIFKGESGHSGRFGCGFSAGNINGDNYDDVVIGAWGYNDRQGRAYLYFGPFANTDDITFTWDTTNASIGKHTLKVEIPPIPGEQNTEDNVKTATVCVKAP